MDDVKCCTTYCNCGMLLTTWFINESQFVVWVECYTLDLWLLKITVDVFIPDVSLQMSKVPYPRVTSQLVPHHSLTHQLSPGSTIHTHQHSPDPTTHSNQVTHSFNCKVQNVSLHCWNQNTDKSYSYPCKFVTKISTTVTVCEDV